MTVIIGVLCKNGVVIGADSSATFSIGTLRTIEQPFEQKIQVIDNHVVGDERQRLVVAGGNHAGELYG